MTTKVFFNDSIKSSIIQELTNAKHEIYVAVAWFNDIDLFNILVEKAENGIKVEVLLSNDPNNFGEPNSLNFESLIEKGGKVSRLITENVLMHNKFCIIDNHTLITGSYNWTFGAFYKNLENIVIIENDIKLCEVYKAEYDRILSEYFTYIKDFDNLLQQISDRVNLLRDQNKSGLLDPNWILNILDKNPGQFMLSGGENSDFNSNFDGQSSVNENSLSEWWDNLPSEWCLYFNDKLLPNGRVNSKPSDDALLFLKNLESISVSQYYTQTYDKYYKINRDTYHINSISGLETLPKLNELKISNSNFTQKSIENLSNLKSLTKLDLSLNQISALPLNYKLVNLIELDISNNQFESLDFLGNLPNLEILHCNSNKLTGTKGIEKSNKLRVIYLDKAVFDLPFVSKKLTEIGFEPVDFESNTIQKLERNL